jgi:hypothetical protein
MSVLGLKELTCEAEIKAGASSVIWWCLANNQTF